MAETPQPEWIPPMLAVLTAERFSQPGWLFEPKLDGERALAWKRGRDVRLWSRNRKLLNEEYPELVAAFEAQRAGAFIADGEIVALDGPVTSFSMLQQRMQVRHPSPALRKRVPVWFYAFDLLYLEGRDLRVLPLTRRKQLLKDGLDFRDPLRYTDHVETEGEAVYEEACRQGWEGIIAKHGASRYVSKRSHDWLKFKCVREQEFVIGGYTDPRGARTGFGALLVGYYESGRLRYAGKVGTGYDTRTLERLAKQLGKLKTSSSPFNGDALPRDAHWVAPKLVAQIGFTEWTGDGKLRHPRFLGLRDDKEPREVTREE